MLPKTVDHVDGGIVARSPHCITFTIIKLRLHTYIYIYIYVFSREERTLRTVWPWHACSVVCSVERAVSHRCRGLASLSRSGIAVSVAVSHHRRASTCKHVMYAYAFLSNCGFNCFGIMPRRYLVSIMPRQNNFDLESVHLHPIVQHRASSDGPTRVERVGVTPGRWETLLGRVAAPPPPAAPEGVAAIGGRVSL